MNHTFSSGTRSDRLMENIFETAINIPCVKTFITGIQRCITISIFFFKFSFIVCKNRSQAKEKLAEPTDTKKDQVADVACQSQPKSKFDE